MKATSRHLRGALRALVDLPRALVLLFIAFYRNVVSPMTPPSCRFQPTCSAYAEEALRRHGLLRGGGLALYRILRCHPFSRGGYEPVPEPSTLGGGVKEP